LTVKYIRKDTARNLAHSWSSVITWNDPGVALYGFASTGRVQSEKHRLDCLLYLRTLRPVKEKDAADVQRLISYIANVKVESE
jgi:hypothetical protein